MTKNWQSRIIPVQITQGSPGKVLEAYYFYYDTGMAEGRGLKLVCGGYEKCAPEYNIDRKGYPYYFIKYTLKGKGVLKFDSQSFKLEPGTISGFSPSVAHQYISDTEEPMEHIFLTFTGRTAGNLLNEHGLDEKFVIHAKEPDRIMGFIENILDTGLENSLFAHEICSEYTSIVLYSIADELSTRTENTNASQQTFLACKQYIDRNFLEMASALEAAHACNINSKYMARLFKKYGRNSPQEYLRNLKMNKAASLLLSSNLAISQIAEIVGYQDPYHFSRNFKKALSLAPKMYRERFIED